METLTTLNGTVSAGLFFLLGPFVSLAIARWWQMRMDLLGGVWGVVADLNIYAATWFSSNSEADRTARELVQRYGLAAHTLLYRGARGQESLDGLVKAGLLLPQEAAVLKPLPSKSQMIFSWLFDFWSHALAENSSGLGTSPVPNAAQQAPIVLKRVLDGRGAAGGALAVVFTQIPFPYVHLLSLLVQSCCIINALCQGAHAGWTLSEPVCMGDAALPTSHSFRYEFHEGCPKAIFVFSFVATGMVFFEWLVSLLVYPIIYHGLLSIGVMLDNTLGADFIDFPGSWYQHVMKAECKGFTTSIDAFREWQSSSQQQRVMPTKKAT
mmetsp:Transcript_5248/g.8804  ORF Transcript_5248/g.8804 Transcript_5248/m.8804 type:complete len:324 (+) Transcript_5248:2-973(+)